MGYLERLESYREDMLKTLAESVSKPSVKADPVKTKDGEILPFGQGVQDALEHMLSAGADLATAARAKAGAEHGVAVYHP